MKRFSGKDSSNSEAAQIVTSKDLKRQTSNEEEQQVKTSFVVKTSDMQSYYS